MEQIQLNQLIKFYENFSCDQRDTQVFHTECNSYLLKQLVIEDKELLDLQWTTQTLQQHLTFHSQYLLTLSHYTIQQKRKNTIVRAVYQYGQTNLQQLIATRKSLNQPFNENQLFSILSMVSKGLLYLKYKGIAYGVLDCSKIFFQFKTHSYSKSINSIKLLDPSATAENPFTIKKGKLFSPQLFLKINNFDLFKSDVYVLGLCIIQAAILNEIPNQIQINPSTLLKKLIHTPIKYSPKLINLLQAMLAQNPDMRPSFTEVADYANNCIQRVLDASDSLDRDIEDVQSLFDDLGVSDCQHRDIMYQGESSRMLSEYDKARIRYGLPLENEAVIIEARESCQQSMEESEFNEKSSNMTKQSVEELYDCVTERTNKEDFDDNWSRQLDHNETQPKKHFIHYPQNQTPPHFM